MTGRLWLPLVILLATVIAIGGIIIWSRYDSLRAAEISLSDTPPQEEPYCQVYVAGDIASPGPYPLKADDSIPTLIQAAGGVRGDAQPDEVRLYVSKSGADSPQKIDINRAEAWLLEALPGIGEEKAKAIVSYRTKNGPFLSTDELTKVAGIGDGILTEIKDLITVAD
jgi:competence protein ComEA